jgi:hypothetical protein
MATITRITINGIEMPQAFQQLDPNEEAVIRVSRMLDTIELSENSHVICATVVLGSAASRR